MAMARHGVCCAVLGALAIVDAVLQALQMGKKPSVAKRHGDAAHSDELSFDDLYELQIQPVGGSDASD